VFRLLGENDLPLVTVGVVADERSTAATYGGTVSVGTQVRHISCVVMVHISQNRTASESNRALEDQLRRRMTVRHSPPELGPSRVTSLLTGRLELCRSL